MVQAQLWRTLGAKRGVDVNTLDEHQNTPLHSAAFRGMLEIVKILLDHGAIVDAENDEGKTPFNLVSQGWLEIAQMLITRGAIVDAAESNKGRTPLHLVSQRDYCGEDVGCVGIARLLLERGVDVNARNKSKTTPLHSAAFNWRPRDRTDAENDDGETPLHLVSQRDYHGRDGVGIARLLLERGVDVNARNKSKTTPLHSAALKGMLEIVQVLLDYGAIADAKNDEGKTPLHLVSQRDYYGNGVGIARLLLERGVDVNARNKSKTTPLHSAAFNGRLEIVQVLLDYGAIADAENDDGETPLDRASQGNYYSGADGASIARLLLERGVDVNARNKSKNTPLHSAAFNEMLEIVPVLLDYGAIADAENDEGETPLNLVLQERLHNSCTSEVSFSDIVRLLLAHGVDVNSQDKYHNTPLHSAAFNCRPTIAGLLLDHGANPSAENEQGETLLHEVSRIKGDFKGVDVARLLLQHGVDVHAQDKDHNTALHSAALNGKFRLVQVLLDHAANPTTENDQGETPLHLLSRGKYDRGVVIIQLLLEHGVDVNGRKRNMWTPLHLAAVKGRFKIARVLLDHGANPTAADEQGETPLHVVSQGKHDSQEDGVRIAQLLLARGADVNALDKDQYTPFDSASYFGRFDIARLLLAHGATDAEPASRGTKRKADDVGSKSRKKSKLHEEIHSAPWRHALRIDLDV
ncbi:ankyrin [Lactarius vividus]|nr:ankyrin [Lactarius vividus]